MDQSKLDAWHMTRALELARHGLGSVDPNPMVGCVIARGAEVIGEGWHHRFGAAHAEIEALAVAGARAASATVYVTLEPCCHAGKTPPCTRALIAAGVERVVAAMRDPFPAVAGQGLAELAAAGIAVESGLLEAEARRLNAPYLKLIEHGRPWIIAKWAMTLDGRIATRTGSSRWISNEASRRVAHALRGRVDAILVGVGTAAIDDPLLTARPPGARTAVRIVLDSEARLGPNSKLVATAPEVPLIVVAAADAPAERCQRLRDAGCEVLNFAPRSARGERFAALLDELGRRRMTNLLVEGGSQVLGHLFDSGNVDEVHVVIAPKCVGGSGALAPVAGTGVAEMADALVLDRPEYENLDGDIYIHGHVATKKS
ncbi:MAG TPA: bifunctional diaminohydroxyphosphoribosylaminopyrimidine deaminase/5-amino-6-(5-phosphoribosylamino)uracil reductase RibD [Pirellulales bacterium]|jgi:diaminohydroxyphosphoribosylaminopyrimidine deaminase/5-amino-6-(5-phosphoribosylamino)uracil reductase|nr:bifunctional diaminohydroxyphosphoribosylaminopyrimidine deaminase/5-amino-6-(5-phosphoribosylamino)uracil reductase RibD [Pirellulales bacterium]